MSDTAITLPEHPTEADYLAALDWMLQEMKHYDEMLEEDRKKFNRNMTEARSIRSGTDVSLRAFERMLDKMAASK